MFNQFKLKYEANYTFHPNLVQYFVPVTDAAFRERLERHKGAITIMLRASDFNQDKTALIVTNNPLPLLISGQHLSVPLKYFPTDVIGKEITKQEPYSLPPLKASQKQMVVPATKKPKTSMPFRFATKNDFQGEAHFSKCYAERRLQKLYPNLRTRMVPEKKLEPLPSIQGWSATVPQWEPLTISCLTETKPTVLVPGDDGFRYGSAPLWIVNSSVPSRSMK